MVDLPSELDVFVDDASNSHGQEGVIPATHEHDCEAHAHPEQWQGPEIEDLCQEVHMMMPTVMSLKGSKVS